MRPLVVASLLAATLFAASARAEEPSIWTQRIEKERLWRQNGPTLIPHQGNYFLPLTYNTSPHRSSRNDAKHIEVKFQLSLKVALAENIVGDNGHLYFGYTQLSLWQLYDRDRSSPFRDTNYEPEIFMTIETERQAGPLTLRQFDVGVSHQSNGVTRPDSRSWNRLYARFIMDRGPFALEVKPWVRLPEQNKYDENRDIYRYMGYGEYTLFHRRGNHLLTVMLRNNFKPHDNKGAVRVDYSFLFTRRITGILQYFSGYGETLLDYNRPNNRFSIGLALGEWR